jgi:hypothetical protein
LSKDEALERISAHSKQHAAEAQAKTNLAEVEAIAKDLGVPVNWDGQQQAQAEHAPHAQQPERQPADGLTEKTRQLLEDPAVRAELEQGLARVTQAEQQYLAGLQQVGQTVVHQALSAYPELTDLTAEQLPVALELMSKQDPQKYVQVKATVDRVHAIGAEIQKTAQLQQARAQQEFQVYAHQQDRIYEALTKDESPEQKRAISQELIRTAKEEYGIAPEQLAHLYHTQPVLRSGVFQHLLHDAMKWRMAQRAKAAATTKPLPSVPTMRPGVQGARVTGADATYQTLDRKLDTLKGKDQIRAAAKMLSMRRRGGR